MADVKVTLTGEDKGAKEAVDGVGNAFQNFSEDLGKSLSAAELTSKALEKLTEYIKELAKEVVEFSKESVEEFFKLESAERKLKQAAGENTEAFIAQAAAMSAHSGVSEVSILTMERMLVAYGEAPSHIQATIKSLQDYATVTGVDAVEATRALTASVSTGKQFAKDLGLEYVSTGEKSSTLDNVTKALAGKFAGASDAEANTLEGAIRRANNQTVVLKQHFGELIAEFLDKTGVVDRIGATIKSLTDALTHEEREKKAKEHAEAMAESKAKLVFWTESAARAEKTLDDMLSDGSSLSAIESQTKAFESLKDEVVAAEKAYEDLAHGKKAGLSDEGFKDGKTHKADAAEQAAALAELKKLQHWGALQDEADEKLESHNREERIKTEATYWDEQIKIQQEGQKKTMEEEDKAQEERAKDFLHTLEQNRKDEEEEDKHWADKSNHMAKGVALAETALYDANKKLEDEMLAAGTRIADAFAGAIVAGIDAAMNGGQFDVLGAVADVAFATAAIAAEAIASAYGEPEVGKALGTAISIAGEIEHHARSNAWASQQKSQAKHHDGGWIEPERYHLGTDEVPAILQAGEAVLSRGDVARMGGRGGVEAARRGGSGGPVVYLSAMDTQGVMEAFQDNSGRGLYNAVLTGRGPLPRLLGVG